VQRKSLEVINGTTNLGLWFPKKKSENLQGYSNSNWAGSLDDIKSTTGYVFSFGREFSIGTCCIS